eukprot:33371-Chlamydomonas_euryale.AAC.1
MPQVTNARAQSAGRQKAEENPTPTRTCPLVMDVTKSSTPPAYPNKGIHTHVRGRVEFHTSRTPTQRASAEAPHSGPHTQH